MKKRNLPLSRVYRLLEPGPVVMLTTAGLKGANVMTMSWHMMVDFEPPIVACVISNRDYTFETLRRTRECVINIPTVNMARKVVGCGNTSGSKTDKFKKFCLTPVPASEVKAPLIDECYASLECKVIDTTMVEKYNIFILEVVKAWAAPHRTYPSTIHHFGRGNFMVAGRTISLPSRMK